MEEFEKRMEARKLKEAQEKSEKQKEINIQEFPVTFNMTILGTSDENAQETLGLLEKMLKGFEDLKDVEGSFRE